MDSNVLNNSQAASRSDRHWHPITKESCLPSLRGILSKGVYQIEDQTGLFRRLPQKEDLLKADILCQELDKSGKSLNTVTETGIIVELSTLTDLLKEKKRTLAHLQPRYVCFSQFKFKFEGMSREEEIILIGYLDFEEPACFAVNVEYCPIVAY